MAAFIEKITKHFAGNQDIEDVVLGGEAWVEYKQANAMIEKGVIFTPFLSDHINYVVSRKFIF